ncbi:MAG: hypothetical protein ACOCPN_01755 [Desulfonatronovibrionaceae bacterium]
MQGVQVKCPGLDKIIVQARLKFITVYSCLESLSSIQVPGREISPPACFEFLVRDMDIETKPIVTVQAFFF